MKKPANSAAIYMKNMMALQKRNPELAQLMQNTVETDRYQVHGGTVQKPPTLLVREPSFPYYDPADPLKDVDEQLAALQLKNTRIAVFLGMGLGYELIRYAQKYSAVQNTRHILIVEKDPALFKTALRNVDLSALLDHQNVRFLVGIAEGDLYTRLRLYLEEEGKFVLLKALKPVYHLSALRLNKDYYMKVLRVVRDAGAHEVLHFGNDPKDSLIGVENMLDNIQEILLNPGVNLLQESMQNRPAVVVSTGPSLNKNKHLLKELESKALIVCPDTSLKVLLDMGVKPHLVTSLERTPGTIRLISGFSKDQLEDVYLAACPVILNEAYEAYPGPRVIVYRDFDHFRWLGIERGILEIKKSSGNMAFKVAEALGCNPIILIGQDLAFGDDGKTHAAGTARGEGGDNMEVFRERGTLEVMGNNGKPVLTSTTWYEFLKVYELDVAGYKGTCINSTEGGAFIQGTQVMPFRESIDRYIHETFDPLAIIHERLRLFSPGDVKQDLAKVRKLINTTVQDVEEIIDYCRAGVNLYETNKAELEGYLKAPATVDANRKRIRQLEQEMNLLKDKARKNRQTFQMFLTHVLQSFHIMFEMDMAAVPEKYEDIDLARVEMCLRQVEWYAVIGDLSLVCLDSLKKAQAKIAQIEI